MIVYKQYKVGDLTFTLSELETDTYQCDQYSDLELNVRVLRQMGATPIDDKPEPPHEYKWLHNKWRTEYLTQCALDTLCNPHEFEPKLDTRFKYHVCQKCGIVISDAEKKAEFYQCKSYYDKNNNLKDCTCGKCGKPIKIEKLQPSYVGAVLVHSEGRLMWEKINEIIKAVNSLKGE